MMEARHFIICGRVQGVAFRWYTTKKANRLGLTGWVKNCSDGSVEAWAEGPSEALRALEGFLRHGPPGAAVRRFESRPAEPADRYSRFETVF